MAQQHESAKGSRRVRLASEQANSIRQKAEPPLHPALRPARAQPMTFAHLRFQ